MTEMRIWDRDLQPSLQIPRQFVHQNTSLDEREIRTKSAGGMRRYKADSKLMMKVRWRFPPSVSTRQRTIGCS
jgi:hypothetical protein